MSARFSLGIDLGTSNSAVALEDFDNGRTAIVEITHLLGPNKVGEKPTLPSALYIPHPEEFPEERPHRGPLRARSRVSDSGSSSYLGEVVVIELPHRSEETGPAMEIRC